NNPTRSGRLYDGYYLSNLQAGQQVQINLDAGFDTYLQLVNADTGALILSDDDGGFGLNSQLTFTAASNTDYIVRATSWAKNATGAYTLATTAGSLTRGIRLNTNETVTGNLVNSDPNNPTRSGRLYDGYYLSNLQAGQQVQINLDADFDTYLQLVNADTGALILSDDDGGFGLNSQLTFTAASNIDYIVRATSWASNATGAYTLTTKLIGSTPPSNPPAFDSTYGYGLVDAAAAVATAIGQTTFADVPNLGGNLWGNDLVKAPEVWAGGYTGQNVVVAVLDTGVDYNHSDLANNIWTNTGEIAGDGIDNDLNGYVDDVIGWDFAYNDNNPNDIQSHGTHVAGTIAGLNNGIGITGVAYNAQIMPVKVLGDTGSGSFQNIADGIRYAADNGADVINLSLGGPSSLLIRNAIEYAQNQGSVVVMAAGNSGLSEPGYPARYATDFGISVGAVDINGQIASFSNRAGLDPSLNHVVAPGVSIYSTMPSGGYAYKSGTSMATPHVAGVVALMLGANPNLTPLQVRQILIDSTAGSGTQSINNFTSSNSTGTTISSLNSSSVEQVPSFAEDLSGYEIAAGNSFESDNSSDETETAIIEFENLVSSENIQENTGEIDLFGVPIRKYYGQGTEMSLASLDFQGLLLYGDKSVVATI
nr:S8 family peptidase [Prochloraceae cyanobacterium]